MPPSGAGRSGSYSRCRRFWRAQRRWKMLSCPLFTRAFAGRNDAGALPTSVEAAVGVLRQLKVAKGETLLILGAGGSVGMIATQLAVRQGLKVIGAIGSQDEQLIRELGDAGLRTVGDVVAYIQKLEEENPEAAEAIRAKIEAERA